VRASPLSSIPPVRPTSICPPTARLGDVVIFAACALAALLCHPLVGQTTVQFDALTPTVTGPGSISYRGTTQSVVAVGTVSSFGLNAMTGGNPSVMSMPALSSTQGFKFNTGVASGNGGGTYINQYTMAFDMYWTANPTSGYESFFNADGTNSTDGDFFRRSSGAIGIGTTVPAYFGNAALNQWNRIVFTVTNTSASQTTIGVYLNGAFLGNSVQSGGTDGRFSLYTGASTPQTLLFTDNNNETGAAYVSQFTFDNRVYSAGEIAALGGASYTVSAIPEPGMYALLAGIGGAGFAVWRRRGVAA
jgi:hypothetical protein